MAQLQVGQLERREMFRRDGRIEISGLDAGELGQVVDHLQPEGPVIEYRNQRDRSLCTATRGTGHCVLQPERPVIVYCNQRDRSLCTATRGTGHCVLQP